MITSGSKNLATNCMAPHSRNPKQFTTKTQVMKKIKSPKGAEQK